MTLDCISGSFDRSLYDFTELETVEEMKTISSPIGRSACLRALLLILLCQVLISAPDCHADDVGASAAELSPQALVKEISSAYRVFRKEWNPAEINLQFSERKSPTGEWSKKRVVHRSSKDGQYRSLLSEVEADGQIQGLVYCVNPEYAFKLGRDTKDSPWAISLYGEKDSNRSDLSANYENVKRLLDINTLGIQFQLIGMNMLPIDELLAHPNTTITGIEYESVELGQRLVTIEFATSAERTMMGEVAPMNIAGLSGSIKLNEKHGWRPVAYRVKTRTGGEIQVEYDGHELMNGHYIPTRLRRDIVKADGTKWNRIKDSSRSFEYDADFGPEIFSLSEYELPDLRARAGGQRVKWHVVLILGSLALFALMVLLIVWHKRRYGST